MMLNIVKSICREYGIMWFICRMLYCIKIKILNTLIFEKLFEKKVDVKRIDIFEFNLNEISEFLSELGEEEKNKIIDLADNAILGQIKGFSSVDLCYGQPINWHLNPITGMKYDKELKWFKIPDFDEIKGDIKIVWEASRFTHFILFIRAYLITGDDKYYIAYSNQLEHWIENNIYSYGVNYKCSQEAALRMINVLFAYSVFNNTNKLSERDIKNTYKIVCDSYKKIQSNFFYAHRCVKNNHTFSEILGLIIGAWCSQENKKIEKFYRLMDQEIVRQFNEDGGFKQYSFNYHRFTLQILECLYKISEKTFMNIKETERVKNSVLMLYNFQQNNGELPNYGSNDGALIFPFSICKYGDYRPVLNTLYALITNERLYESGKYDEELLWFKGKRDCSYKKINRNSIAYSESGFYVFRDEKTFLMTCLQEFKTRPSHMDQLHIDLWYNNVNILCDSGTYSYASTLGRYLASTDAHNVAKIPKIEQMNRKSIFMPMQWTEKKSAQYSDLSFKGKFSSQNGYTHEREIIKTKRGFSIIDTVDSKSEVCQFIFHTPCDIELVDKKILLIHNGIKLAVLSFEEYVLIEDCYASTYYMKKNRINKMIFVVKTKNDLCSAHFKIELI